MTEPASVYGVVLTKTQDGCTLARLKSLAIAECEGKTATAAYVALASELELVAEYLSAKASDLREAARNVGR